MFGCLADSAGNLSQVRKLLFSGSFGASKRAESCDQPVHRRVQVILGAVKGYPFVAVMSKGNSTERARTVVILCAASSTNAKSPPET